MSTVNPYIKDRQLRNVKILYCNLSPYHCLTKHCQSLVMDSLHYVFVLLFDFFYVIYYFSITHNPCLIFRVYFYTHPSSSFDFSFIYLFISVFLNTCGHAIFSSYLFWECTLRFSPFARSGGLELCSYKYRIDAFNTVIIHTSVMDCL